MSTHKDRIAVITGGRRGIGRGIANLLAARGARVVIVNKTPAQDIADKIGNGAIAITAEISQESEWTRVARELDDKFGRVDILINNAGVYYATALPQLAAEIWRSMMAINLDAVFFGIRAMVPLMQRNKWGRIVNIGSNAVGMSMDGMSHYISAKMGVVGLTRGLASELAQDNITINVVHPGLTNTEGASIMPEEIKATIYTKQAIKRLGQPADVAGPVAFLTSDDGAFLTGQTITADGGFMRL
jgi:NAD(P)-dependent dehydrogenase (short-subunit alcohol dehydrogenase family)